MSIVVKKDLRSMFGQVRDQDARATCLAFAASTAHGATFGPYRELSVEYLFACAGARETAFSPEDGIQFSSMHLALSLDGQPDESQYPYDPMYPPAAALPRRPAVAGPLYKKSCAPTPGSSVDIIRLLDMSIPVVLGLAVNTAFYLATGQPDGLVDPHPTIYTEVGGHAVVALGHGHDDTDAGSFRILIRNSWGVGWGLGGEAWLTSQYVDSRLHCFGYMQ